MTCYFVIELRHLIGAIRDSAHRHGDRFLPAAGASKRRCGVARTAALVIIADMLFTLAAVLPQPVPGTSGLIEAS